MDYDQKVAAMKERRKVLDARAHAEVYCFIESPLAVFKEVVGNIKKEIKKTCSREIAEVIKESKRAVGMHSWKVIVGRHEAKDDYNEEFLSILLFNESQYIANATKGVTNKEEIAKQSDLLSTKFCKFSPGVLINGEPVANDVIAVLSEILSKEISHELNRQKRFIAEPLPERFGKVSKTLGISEERVLSGILKSDVFTYGRLLRSFGNNFMDEKPSKHGYVLLPVTGALFNFMSNRKDQEAIPFGYVWVDDKDWDGKSPYDKKYRSGTKYYVQVRLTDFIPRFKAAVAEVLERGGEDDDMI
jgi:hypothetical protein